VAKVKVRSFTVVREALGSGLVEVDVDHPETVQGVLDTLLRQYDGPLKKTICDPQTGEMAPFLVRLNDEIISSTLDKDTPVKSGDEFSIIFPIGGGS
jgi:molybdopterin converting factor small subunit